MENKRVLKLAVYQLIFNEKECLVLNVRDITEIQASEKLKSEVKLLGLYSSTISHEMLLPLKNIIAMSSQLEEEFASEVEVAKSAHIVKISGQLLLSQIKTQLDQNLISNNKF